MLKNVDEALEREIYIKDGEDNNLYIKYEGEEIHLNPEDNLTKLYNNMAVGEIIFIKREDWEKIKDHKLFKQGKLKRIEAEYLSNLINIDDLGYSKDIFPPLLTLYTNVFVNLVNTEYMFSAENDVVNKRDIDFSDLETYSSSAIPPEQRTLFNDRTDAWHIPVFKNLREKYTKAKEIPGFVNPYTHIEAQEEKENILHQVKEELFKLIAIEKNGNYPFTTSIK